MPEGGFMAIKWPRVCRWPRDEFIFLCLQAANKVFEMQQFVFYFCFLGSA
jgi:hypothetical protein